MWQKIKNHLLSSMGFYTCVFIILYIVAWTLNAVKSMHFDLDKLENVYKWLLANHGVNSVCNSPWGVMPGNEGGNDNASNNASGHPENG